MHQILGCVSYVIGLLRIFFGFIWKFKLKKKTFDGNPHSRPLPLYFMSTVPTHSLSFISSTILSQLDIILDGRVDHWKRSSITSARCCTVLMYSIGPPFVIFPPSCHGHPRLHDCIVACSSISLLCYLSAKISFTPS